MNRCAHWIGSDATGRRCSAESERTYCDEHFEIEKRRAQKLIEKQRAQTARTEALWFARNAHRLPYMRVQLERAEAEYTRRTASAVDDRAAVGGDTHRSITRAQSRILSDSNVQRVVELQRVIERLTADIERLERS